MPVARAFLVGLMAGAAIVVAVLAGDRLDGAQLLAVLAVPLAALAGAALFGTGATGWGARALRGGVAAVIAAAVGIAAVFVLRDVTDWFEWPDEHGGDVFFMILAALAAVPGGTAAAARTPAQGLALAGGFSLGLGLGLALVATAAPGLLVMLAIGTIVGTLVSRIGRR